MNFADSSARPTNHWNLQGRGLFPGKKLSHRSLFESWTLLTCETISTAPLWHTPSLLVFSPLGLVSMFICGLKALLSTTPLSGKFIRPIT